VCVCVCVCSAADERHLQGARPSLSSTRSHRRSIFDLVSPTTAAELDSVTLELPAATEPPVEERVLRAVRHFVLKAVYVPCRRVSELPVRRRCCCRRRITSCSLDVVSRHRHIIAHHTSLSRKMSWQSTSLQCEATLATVLRLPLQVVEAASTSPPRRQTSLRALDPQGRCPPLL
jgi:hypothetical protein